MTSCSSFYAVMGMTCHRYGCQLARLRFAREGYVNASPGSPPG